MKRIVMLIAISLLTTACQSDNGVTRLDNCVCYKTVEGQKTQASPMDWQDTEKVREQFSHCICRAWVDLEKADDPNQFFGPETQIRTEMKSQEK
ncbi:hypothetical protein D3C76_913420 [compost metagenome]|jgi:hypothetical protein|uniref:Uncharacterized protein n=1 Tax=Pseudomonas umsongensis TaxID=198618 RepID=A0AAE7DDT9_9PSED|nr:MULTISPECIES: hypothetical protein [Pseudomonas]EPA99186.1 hypothetical protein PG5_03300 [Pseudomonas sp. G5(2012)]MBT9575594.1 hypothetical protein [Pseudomonas umsongensis]MDI3394405.1 hypothetical protein [Pseudomonas sp. V98_8]OXR28194.1 hypothetical protein PSUM_29495 [Pseudomonas umsongensis]QFG29078.1 hypothetical protein F6476_07605 [Pseudomonas umsongensis]